MADQVAKAIGDTVAEVLFSDTSNDTQHPIAATGKPTDRFNAEAPLTLYAGQVVHIAGYSSNTDEFTIETPSTDSDVEVAVTITTAAIGENILLSTSGRFAAYVYEEDNPEDKPTSYGTKAGSVKLTRGGTGFLPIGPEFFDENGIRRVWVRFGVAETPSMFADNATGDDLVAGEVVEVTAYDATTGKSTIRKPSAVNLLNIAVCTTDAAVGERVELTTDGTHTVSVTGSVALGETLGTVAGSTGLAAIGIGETGYPAIGFVAMSASSGGSCQARFFSSSLPCRQPDRAFGTIAKIGVGGGTEDVTVSDLYELKTWIGNNWGYSVYHATLYADQIVDSDLSMAYKLILDGNSHKITTVADLTLSNTYAMGVDFELDEDADIDMRFYVLKGGAFSYVGEDQIEIDIRSTLCCGCAFTFDRLENLLLDLDYAHDCTFVITEDLSLNPDKEFLLRSSHGITNSNFTFSTTGVWHYGSLSLTYEINAALTDCVYNYDHDISNTRKDTEGDMEGYGVNYEATIVHPSLTNCTTSVQEDATLTGSLTYFGSVDQKTGADVYLVLDITHGSIVNTTYSPEVVIAISLPDAEKTEGGASTRAGASGVIITERFTGELINAKVNTSITASVDGGNGTNGTDGSDGTGGRSGGAGGIGGDGSACLLDIARGVSLDSMINTNFDTTIVLDIDGGVGGDGGAGGNSSPEDGTGGAGGAGGNCYAEIVFGGYERRFTGIPQYTSSFTCTSMYGSTIAETRSITSSGSAGGNGGKGGDQSIDPAEPNYNYWWGGDGGAGGTGVTGGDGGAGGIGGNGYAGFAGFITGGRGGVGGTGYTAGSGGAGGDAHLGEYMKGGRGGNGGDGFPWTDDEVPNTAGSGGSGGLGGNPALDAPDGTDGDPRGGAAPILRYEFTGVLYKYQVATSTNTDYFPVDDWPGSMDANGTIYIDPTTGDDTNDGQSWANAIKTFPLFTRDGETVGYLISDVEYANFTGQQIGVMRPESTVTTYRTITGDGTVFTSNPAGEKVSVENCSGIFDGFDGVLECIGTFLNSLNLSLCTGVEIRNCTGVISCGSEAEPFPIILYSNDVTGCHAVKFDGCVDLAGCVGKQSGSGNAFEDCFKLDLCDGSLGQYGFFNCSDITNSDAHHNTSWGFYTCREIDWDTCTEYDNGQSCVCPPEYPPSGQGPNCPICIL